MHLFYMKAMESMHRHRVLSNILNQIHVYFTLSYVVEKNFIIRESINLFERKYAYIELV